VVVVEVERPDRKLRRNAGKSDPIDAEAAARKVLSGEATVTPKSGTGNVEMIRVLRLTRRSAVVSRSQVTNQLHALTVTAPPALREQLEGRTTRARVTIAAKFRPGGAAWYAPPGTAGVTELPVGGEAEGSDKMVRAGQPPDLHGVVGRCSLGPEVGDVVLVGDVDPVVGCAVTEH
jgi:transposase